MANAGLSITSWRPFADRRRVVVLTGSVLFHAAVLAPLAWGLFSDGPHRVSEAHDPPIFVEIEPRPLLDGETAREPSPTTSAAREATATLGETIPPTRERRREEDEDDQPITPNPRSGIAMPSSATPDTDSAWRVTPDSLGSAIGRASRTGAGGCRIMYDRLTAGERALCDERFNAAAGNGRPIGPRTLTPSEQRQQAQFARDGAAAIAQYEARRRPLSGGVGIVGPADCPGSNFGAGCAGAHLDPAIRQGATTVGNPGMRQERPDAMRPIPGQE